MNGNDAQDLPTVFFYQGLQNEEILTELCNAIFNKHQ